MSDWESILRWYLAITAATVAFYPLVAVVGKGLGPAHVGLARPLGIVLVSAMVWWPASVVGLPLNGWTLWGALLAAACGLWIWWFRRPREALHIKAIIAFDVAWLCCFLGYAWFRSYYPDIVNTEKPMEIALLTSIVRSSDVPAPDPWLSGSTINYYYFGYQVFGSAIKLSGVQAVVGFNLALATVFASTVTAVSAAGAGLAHGFGMRGRSILAAAGVSAILVAIAGNLETPRRLLSNTRETIEAGWWDGVGWQASRVIVDTNVHQAGDSRQTINEFPAFSFVLGDLHPHVMTYPLLAAALAMAIGFALSRGTVSRTAVVVAGAFAGLLYASNSWDAPLGLALLVGALILSGWREGRQTLMRVALLVVAAGITVLPFLSHYTAPVGVPNDELPSWLINLPVAGTVANTLGVVYWRPSSARELILVHGLWIATFTVFAVFHLRRDARVVDWLRTRAPFVIVAVLLLLGASVAWVPALLLIGVPMALATWIAFSAASSSTRVLGGVFAAGFLLVLIPEFVFLQDVFMDRMNTVFKFYFQAWLLLAIASAVALIEVVRSLRGLGRAAIACAGVAAIATVTTYAPLSAWDWTSGFQTRYGLDGSAYLTRSAPGDYAAIEWIRAHAEEGDWLVEAPGCSYSVVEGAPMSRVSAFSGVPALIGWYGHEGQWRRGENRTIYERLNARTLTANAILDGAVPPTVDGPSFVVMGRQERFGAIQCDRVSERPEDVEQRLLEGGWVQAFESEQTVIFVPPWRAPVAQ